MGGEQYRAGQLRAPHRGQRYIYRYIYLYMLLEAAFATHILAFKIELVFASIGTGARS